MKLSALTWLPSLAVTMICLSTAIPTSLTSRVQEASTSALQMTSASLQVQPSSTSTLGPVLSTVEAHASSSSSLFRITSRSVSPQVQLSSHELGTSSPGLMLSTIEASSSSSSFLTSSAVGPQVQFSSAGLVTSSPGLMLNTPDDNSSSSGDSNVSVFIGVAIGAAVGLLLGIVVTAVVAWMVVRRQRRKTLLLSAPNPVLEENVAYSTVVEESWRHIINPNYGELSSQEGKVPEQQAVPVYEHLVDNPMYGASEHVMSTTEDSEHEYSYPRPIVVKDRAPPTPPRD